MVWERDALLERARDEEPWRKFRAVRFGPGWLEDLRRREREKDAEMGERAVV